MKKIMLASLLFASGSALANTAPSTPTLVGRWLCEAVVYQGNSTIQTKNVATYQPSGHVVEVIQVNYYEKGALHATSNIRLGYQWELIGGRQKMSNMMIDAYDLYNHTTQQSAHFGEIALLKRSLIDQYQNNPYQTITFIDNNTHQYTADDGSTGICVREQASTIKPT